MGPLITVKVYESLRAALRSGANTAECSLDLDRSKTVVTINAADWSWQGQRYPYLDSCKDRTIYYWTGERFEPVARFDH